MQRKSLLQYMKQCIIVLQMLCLMIQQLHHQIDDANVEILNNASYVPASMYEVVHHHFDDALFDDTTVAASY